MECCKSVPVVDFATSLYNVSANTMTYDFVLQKINTFTLIKQYKCMENQYLNNSTPHDSSHQVGDQFLISAFSGSPQTRFGRIGEW